MTETPLKEAVYELVEIPEEFGRIEALVDDHKIKSFAFSQDDYHPWYFGDSLFGKRIGHASILANDVLQLYHTRYDKNTVVGLHAQEELWYHNPVFHGEVAVLQGRYIDKYEKRGKGYVVMEAEARGQDGRLLLQHRGVEIMRTQPGLVVGRKMAAEVERRVTGEYRRDVEPAAHARLGLPPRTPIVPLIKHVHQDQMATFSLINVHMENIHNNLKTAQKAGLHLPIVQGQQQVCFIAELMTNFFGGTWFTSGHQKMKFINPVYSEETITCRGVVMGETLESSGTRLELEVWVETESAGMTAVGWASALVGPPVV